MEAGEIVAIIIMVVGVLFIILLAAPRITKLAESIASTLGFVQKCDATGKVPEQYESDISIALDDRNINRALDLYAEFKRCFPRKKLTLDLSEIPTDVPYTASAGEFVAFCIDNQFSKDFGVGNTSVPLKLVRSSAGPDKCGISGYDNIGYFKLPQPAAIFAPIPPVAAFGSYEFASLCLATKVAQDIKGPPKREPAVFFSQSSCGSPRTSFFDKSGMVGSQNAYLCVDPQSTVKPEDVQVAFKPCAEGFVSVGAVDFSSLYTNPTGGGLGGENTVLCARASIAGKISFGSTACGAGKLVGAEILQSDRTYRYLCVDQALSGAQSQTTLPPVILDRVSGGACATVGYVLAGAFSLPESRLGYARYPIPYEFAANEQIGLCVLKALDDRYTGRTPPIILDKLVGSGFGDKCTIQTYTNVGHFKVPPNGNATLPRSTSDIADQYVKDLDTLAKSLKT